MNSRETCAVIIFFCNVSIFSLHFCSFQGWSISTWHWFLSVDSPTVYPAPFCGYSDPLWCLESLLCTMCFTDAGFHGSFGCGGSIVQRDTLSPNRSDIWCPQHSNLFHWCTCPCCLHGPISSGAATVLLMLERGCCPCLWPSERSPSLSDSEPVRASKMSPDFHFTFLREWMWFCQRV